MPMHRRSSSYPELGKSSLPKKLGSPSMLQELERATQFSELDQNVVTLRTGPVSWDKDRRCNHQ